LRTGIAGALIAGRSSRPSASSVSNVTGVWIEAAASPSIQSNVFDGNTTAIKTLSLLPSFSNNTTQNNSLNGILVSGFGFSDLINEVTWQKANLPYVFESYITITSSQTLNIQAGTIIKFKSDARIYVDGSLKAQGSGSDKIIFTSFNDDEYGGDTNNDGLSTPYAGYWDFVSFSASSASSVLNNVIVRYGGWYNQPFKKGAIKIDSNNVVVSNSLFENNLVAGLELYNSTTTITGTTFQNHQAKYNADTERSRALWLQNSVPLFTSTAFNSINFYLVILNFSIYC